MRVRVVGDQLVRLDGGRLAELRRAHGFTLRDVEDMTGVSRMTICNWENEESMPRDTAALTLLYGDALRASGALTIEPLLSRSR